MRPPTRIPTLVGILFVLLIVGIVGFAFERISRNQTTASGSIEPTSVEITNISDMTFTVSWLTESAATGAVSIESPAPRQTLFDERDQVGKLGSYRTHSVTMRSAQPNTEYTFTILSNGKTHRENGEPFRIRTAATLTTQTSPLEPAFGIVVTESTMPAEGALVYLTPLGGQTLSALVKPSGSWLIPLNLARSSDLTAYLPVQERIDEDILVRFDGADTIAVTDTLNDNPVPDMTLGKTYDFRKQQANAQTGQLAAANPAVLGQTTQLSTAFAITSPAQQAAVSSDLPLIQGTGMPGKPVSVTIGITNPIGGTVTVGADGIWRYTPSQTLTPGQQSVTATSIGANGQPTAITHLFEILKSGTQVLGDATPSATLIPLPTPIATDTATLAGQPIPTSGSMLPTIILLLAGATLIAGGGLLVRIR